MDETDLLTIGAFAARARLSAKALRLYDRLGLLAPAHVDEAGGYRYYRADQIDRARLVALLRQVDMPLARIAEVVGAGGSETGGSETGGSEAAALLAAYWADVETRVAGQRTLVETSVDACRGGAPRCTGSSRSRRWTYRRGW